MRLRTVHTQAKQYGSEWITSHSRGPGRSARGALSSRRGRNGYLRPEHPETAVLETGLRSSTIAGVLFGLLFVLVATFVLAIQMPLLFARKPEG